MTALSVCRKHHRFSEDATQCYGYSLHIPIQPFLAIMSDKIIIKGPWGPVQPHHFLRLSRVSYGRFLHTKTKQTTTYINSPLTGAQIEVVYMVETVAGIDTGYVQISIPVASALIGHNYFHAGLEVLRYEIKCLELLVKVLLVSIGMSPDEIHRYMKQVRTLLDEMTWHTETASVAARKACQRRTNDHMRTKRALSPRHDAQVTDAEIFDTKSGIGLFVTLKSDDFFRQYCKGEQIKVRRKKARSENFLSEAMRPKLAGLLERLDRQVRNELLIGEKTLASVGIRHPRDMHPDALEKAMVRVWCSLGFGARRNTQNLSMPNNTAKDTLQRIEAGEDLSKSLPAYRITRDRKAINKAGGPDIAEKRAGMRFNSANLGRQLQYPRRRKLLYERRDLVVSDRTDSAIMKELQQGLEFVTNGVLPDIADPAQETAWHQCWMTFARAEHLNSLLRNSGDTDSLRVHEKPANPTPAQETAPLAVSQEKVPRVGRGVGQVPMYLSGDDDGIDPHVRDLD